MPRGNWRRVTIEGAHAIKVPRPDRPELAAGARLLNLWEWELWHDWQPRYGWDYLCPAIRCSPDGSELVMRAATPCGEADRPALFRLFDEIGKHHPYGAPLGECKVADWGTLEGRFVLLDYGAECYEAAEIASARASLTQWVEAAEAEQRMRKGA
jgi:hypothetical protein